MFNDLLAFAFAHQAVINVLDASRRAGLNRITFAAQVNPGGSAAP